MELSRNKIYVEWKTRSITLFQSVTQNMPPELLEQFEQYQETLGAISGMESDYCYLRGVCDYLSIEEQFKKPDDWQALSELMITSLPGMNSTD